MAYQSVYTGSQIDEAIGAALGEIQLIQTDYTMVKANKLLQVENVGGADIEISLLPVDDAPDKIIRIKKIIDSIGDVNITPSAGDTIDDQSSISPLVAEGEVISMRPDPSRNNWIIINRL